MKVYFYTEKQRRYLKRRKQWRRLKGLKRLFKNAKKNRLNPTYSERVAYQIIMSVASGGEEWKTQWVPQELWKHSGRTWYILDFYCPQLRIAVEIDGFTHQNTIREDNLRDMRLRALGISTIRIPADLVTDDPNYVQKQLRTILEARRNATTK